MRRLKTVRRPPIYPKTPGHLPCSSLTHPLPLSSRRPSVSFGGFGLTHAGLPADQVEGHREGWDHYMPRLAMLAEGKDPGPDPWASNNG